jgi:hypothetical protein
MVCQSHWVVQGHFRRTGSPNVCRGESGTHGQVRCCNRNSLPLHSWAEIANTKEGARALARRYNDYGFDFRQSNRSRPGFFGAVPSLDGDLDGDLEGAIADLKYALDEKHVDGSTLLASYGLKYLGRLDFKPLWAELNKRNAVVFVYPTHAPTGNWARPRARLANDRLPLRDNPHSFRPHHERPQTPKPHLQNHPLACRRHTPLSRQAARTSELHAHQK